MRTALTIVTLTAVAASALAATSADAGRPGKGLGTLTYVYAKPVPLPPGEDTAITVDCPRGTVALSGGFTQFVEADESTSPDIVVGAASVVSAGGPPFDPRRFEAFLLNTGTRTDVLASARVVCAKARDVKLVAGA